MAPDASTALECDSDDVCSDNFRMMHMKVQPCSKRFVHDWTECPFAHPQEKARRRDPRAHTYTGIACPSMKKDGVCAFGDHCPYAHNVFEYWLHPTRYRTQLCNDGSACKRKICFFAHSLDELRVPANKPFVSPEALAIAASAAAADAEARRCAGALPSLAPPPRAAAAPPSPWAMARSPFESGSPRKTVVLDAQEGQVVGLVTQMLGQGKLSAEQAAGILQQMLPAGALHALQAHLASPPPIAQPPTVPRPHSDPGMPDLLHARQLQQRAAEADAAQAAAYSLGFEAAQRQGLYPPGHSAQAPALGGRDSMESSRSSFDSMRMSFEAAGLGGGAEPPNAFQAHLAANYPEGGLPSSRPSRTSWGGNPLSAVPEGFPLIATRPSSYPWTSTDARQGSLDLAPGGWSGPRTGGSMESVGSGTAASRLGSLDRVSQDMQRLSFDAEAGRRAAPQVANPFSSAFFTPSLPQLPQQQQPDLLALGGTWANQLSQQGPSQADAAVMAALPPLKRQR